MMDKITGIVEVTLIMVGALCALLFVLGLVWVIVTSGGA